MGKLDGLGPLETPVAKVTKAGKLAGLGPVTPEVKPPPPFDPVAGTMDFVTDLLRNFNDTLTFGLYDKGVDAVEGAFGGSGRRNQDETKNSNAIAAIAGKTLGGIPGGLGFEKAAATLIPSLAKNTIPSIAGRSAISSGAMSATDDVVRDGEIDPIGVAADAGLGGLLAGGLGVLSRTVSPGARVRAKGNELTEADKQAAAGYSASAASKGILLDNVEALNKVAPERAVDVAAMQDAALTAPLGSQIDAAFNARRQPGIRAAGEQVVQDLGGSRSPFDIQVAAKEAMDTVDGGFTAAAGVPMSTAATKKVPPTHIPQTEAYHRAAKDLMDDPVALEALGSPSNNSISFLEEVRQNAARRAEKSKSPAASGAFRQTEERLGQLMDKAGGRAGYTEARRIADQGRDVVSELEAGPLGRIAGSSKSASQGGALFGVTNSAEADAAKEAVRHLPGFANQGILANSIESAASRSPNGSIREALPNEHSVGVARDVTAGIPGGADVDQVVDLLRAVDDRMGMPHQADDRSGPVGQLWSAFRDYGKEGVAKLLQDPKWIAKMGKMGGVQAALQNLLTSGERASNIDDRMPIDITIFGGN